MPNSDTGITNESEGIYYRSKDGLLRLITIVFGIISFALFVSAFSVYRLQGLLAWSFAAFLTSWILSLLFYLLILTNMAPMKNCVPQFKAADYCFSLILLGFFLSGSIALLPHSDQSPKGLASTIFGFITSFLYFMGLHLHEDDAPGSTKYVTTRSGVAKFLVMTFGCMTFVLLKGSSLSCVEDDSCTAGITFAFIAFVISCGITIVFFLSYMAGLNKIIGDGFETTDLCIATLSFIFILTASIVLATNLKYEEEYSKRLAADVFGFFTTFAYLLEILFLWTPSDRDAAASPE